MSFALPPRSGRILEGVHPDLARVVQRAAAIAPADLSFVVTEGLRSAARQQQLFDAGATRTMNSRHLDGHAVDLAAEVGGEIRWDWPLYDRLADVMKAAAAQEQVRIEWGGDWVSFRDGPHFQLPFRAYPARA